MTDEPTADEATPETPAQRLASVFMSAWTKAKLAALPDEHAGRHSAVDDHLDRWEVDIAPTMEKVLRPYLDSDALPDEWREVLQKSVEPEHAFGFLLSIAEFFGAVLAVLPALGAVTVQPYINQAWEGAPTKPLSLADAADARMRGVTTNLSLEQEAQMSGYSVDTFNTMVALSGEPPGPVDLLKLWLRGDMSTPDLEAAIKYSRIHDSYIPVVEKMAYSQMTPADAIMTAIKQVIPLAESRALFVRGGGLDSDFEILYQAAGDSIAIQQVLTLWRFGLATETDVDQALGRSRINPMFYPLAKLTHFKPLSAFQISAAVKAGVITSAQAEQWLVQDGVPADQAHALSQVHGSTGTTKAHTETESLVTAAYEEGIYQRAQAQTALQQIGYQPAVADLILTVADAKRANAQLNHAVSVVRANYVARRIDRTTATNDLDTLEVPPAARNKWLADWDLEIAAHPKTLTAVQLADAGKDRFLTPEVVYARIQQEGYTPEDAKVMMLLHKAPLPAGV